MQNGTESDADCGGSCGPCADGKACAAASDCVSALCGAGACQVPTCADGVRNGDESDTDTFLLGSRELLGLDDVDTNVYSPQSPLGAAVLGKSKGDQATYTAPNGRKINVTVVTVEPYRG